MVETSPGIVKFLPFHFLISPSPLPKDIYMQKFLTSDLLLPLPEILQGMLAIFATRTTNGIKESLQLTPRDKTFETSLISLQFSAYAIVKHTDHLAA